jgi:hypothetical protein
MEYLLVICTFAGGFFTRALLLKYQVANQNHNEYIKKIEILLDKMLDEGVTFLSHKKIKAARREHLRKLMIVRNNQLQHYCRHVERLAKESCCYPTDKLQALKKNSDSLFEEKLNDSSLGLFADSYVNLLTYYVLQTPKIV